MLCNIKYVYDKTKDEKTVLLGAKLYLYDGVRIQTQEIYVGVSYTLEEVINSDEVVKLLKVKDKEAFARTYNELGATGIIYFPQTGTASFLEKQDIVIPWDGEEKVESLLGAKIAEYKNHKVDEKVKNTIARHQQEIEDLDPGNSLAELCEYPRVRQRYSCR